MSGVPTLAALVAVSGLVLLAGPTPVPAQPKPDVFVTVGTVIQESAAIRVPVLVGNQTDFPPLPNVDYGLSLTVLSASSQVVCERQTQVATVAPNSSRTAFHFVLSYPSGIPGPGLKASAVRSTQYRIIARASPTQPCLNVDANCGNNTVIRQFSFPVGGTPACIRLLL
jgi:hypothetical protein